MHRRMSGNVLYRTPADPPDDYVRAIFALDDGHELRWTDLRKFGTMWLVEDATMVMESLGPEPLEAEFTPEVLRERAGKRSAPIKSVILDQTVLAGMGNLYTDEALHYAKIHPLRPGEQAQARRLGAPARRHPRALRMGIDGARQQPRQRRCATTSTSMARPARTRRPCRRTAARASPASSAARRCAASRSAAAAASSARSASRRRAARRVKRTRPRARRREAPSEAAAARASRPSERPTSP